MNLREAESEFETETGSVIKMGSETEPGKALDWALWRALAKGLDLAQEMGTDLVSQWES